MTGHAGSQYPVLKHGSAGFVANYFIKRSFESGELLSPLKLIKLVYMAYGWWLAVKQERLFGERIEAWKYGPVIPSLYHEFKCYGRLPISKMSQRVVFSDNVDESSSSYEKANGICQEETEEPLPEGVQKCLEWIWQSYSPYTAVALSVITHQEKTPWAEARARSEEEGSSAPLDDVEIFKHFKEKLDKNLGISHDEKAMA